MSKMEVTDDVTTSKMNENSHKYSQLDEGVYLIRIST